MDKSEAVLVPEFREWLKGQSDEVRENSIMSIENGKGGASVVVHEAAWDAFIYDNPELASEERRKEALMSLSGCVAWFRDSIKFKTQPTWLSMVKV